jgi:hypothetical protein
MLSVHTKQPYKNFVFLRVWNVYVDINIVWLLYINKIHKPWNKPKFQI